VHGSLKLHRLPDASECKTQFQNPGRGIGLIKRLSDSLTATVARKYVDCENSRALIDPEALNHHEKPHGRASRSTRVKRTSRLINRVTHDDARDVA